MVTWIEVEVEDVADGGRDGVWVENEAFLANIDVHSGGKRHWRKESTEDNLAVHLDCVRSVDSELWNRWF